MSQAASQAHAFYREVTLNRKLWTVRDADGYPAPKTSSGQRSQPFWSSLSRVQKIIKTVPDYSGFVPEEITWQDFRDSWIPSLESDGFLIGVNWSGPRAVGYDMEPSSLRSTIEERIKDSTPFWRRLVGNMLNK